MFVLLFEICNHKSEISKGGKLMADDNGKTCKNPSCTCPPQDGGKYCSAQCEGAGDTIELDCDCGHEACGGNF